MGNLNQPVGKVDYIAIAKSIPTIGQPFNCLVISNKQGHPSLTSVKTTAVNSVVKRGDDIYEITTQNSVYMVQIS